MKSLIKLTLAALLTGGTAWAQSEQWLEYHTGDNYHGYIYLQATTNAPPGVKLPSLDPVNGTPYFAAWETPLDPSGRRWICIDRTRKSGPYNRLYIDSNGDGRLDDEKPILAQVDSSYAMFPVTPLRFKGEDGPITYHIGLRFYQYEDSPVQLLAQSACSYEGNVNFDGVKKRLTLMDYNVNGVFNDIVTNSDRADCLTIEGDTDQQRYLGRLLEVDGKYFTFTADRDGAFVKVQKTDVALGTVQIPSGISLFSANGANGHFVRHATNGVFTMPSGNYRVQQWEIKRKDGRGETWTLTGYNFPGSNSFEVVAGQTVRVDIGDPVKANLTARNDDQQINFDLRFTGKQGEAIQFLRGNERPTGPKLMLASADGVLRYTNTFEFG